MTIIGRCCHCSKGVKLWANIKRYNFQTGDLSWEHFLWNPVVANDNTVAGTIWVASTLNFSDVFYGTDGLPQRDHGDHSTAGKNTWELKYRRIDTVSGAIVSDSDPVRYGVFPDDVNPNGPGQSAPPFSLHLDFRTQNYGATGTMGLVSYGPIFSKGPVIGVVNPYSSSETLRYQILPFPQSPRPDGHTPGITLQIPAFGPDAAGDVFIPYNMSGGSLKTALEAYPQIVSVTIVKAGPLPASMLEFHVQWIDSSLQFGASVVDEYLQMGRVATVNLLTGDLAGWVHGKVTHLSTMTGTAFDTNDQLISTGGLLTSVDPSVKGWHSGFDLVAAEGFNWTTAISHTGGLRYGIKDAIIIAGRKDPQGTVDEAGVRGNLFTLDLDGNITNGPGVPAAEVVTQFPHRALFLDDRPTHGYVSGTSHMRTSEDDTTVDHTEEVSVFDYERIFSDFFDSHGNPVQIFNSGVGSVAASSTGLAFGIGQAQNHNLAAGCNIETVPNWRKITDRINGDSNYPFEHFQVLHITASPINYRVSENAEWRFGLHGGENRYTKWFAFNAGLTEIETELELVFGSNTHGANVTVVFDNAGVTLPPRNLMMWQGSTTPLWSVVDAQGLHGTLGGNDGLGKTADAVIQVRNAEPMAEKSFGRFDLPADAVTWQRNFDHKSDELDTDLDVALDNGSLLVHRREPVRSSGFRHIGTTISGNYPDGEQIAEGDLLFLFDYTANNGIPHKAPVGFEDMAGGTAAWGTAGVRVSYAEMLGGEVGAIPVIGDRTVAILIRGTKLSRTSLAIDTETTTDLDFPTATAKHIDNNIAFLIGTHEEFGAGAVDEYVDMADTITKTLENLTPPSELRMRVWQNGLRVPAGLYDPDSSLIDDHNDKKSAITLIVGDAN